MGSEWSPTGIPAVSAKNVKAGRLVRPDTCNFVSEELYERWMKDKLALGDILMTSEAPLGELYYLALDARFCLSQRIFAMRANPAVCEPAVCAPPTPVDQTGISPDKSGMRRFHGSNASTASTVLAAGRSRITRRSQA